MNATSPTKAILGEAGDNMPNCSDCESPINGDHRVIDSDYICEPCFETLERDTESEATQFAQQNCIITETLPAWDASMTWPLVPDDYDLDNRVSQIRNAYRSWCRHNFTNHDELASSLDKCNPLDLVRLSAISDRIDLLIDHEIERNDQIRFGDD